LASSPPGQSPPKDGVGMEFYSTATAAVQASRVFLVLLLFYAEKFELRQSFM
jgi:hypothetical protein